MSTVFARAALIMALCMATGFVTSVSGHHSWNNFHWARHNYPFTLKTGDNVSAAWDTYLDDAIHGWSHSAALDLTKVVGGTSPATCAPTAGRIEVCNAAYGATGWLGIAQVWLADAEHITQATTKVNDTYFNTATYNTPAWRRLVMCQEIAHDFGLDHQDEAFNNPNLGSCMDYTSDPDGPPSNEWPNGHDYEQVEWIYAHHDATTTVGNPKLPSSMPPAMGDIVLDTPAQWGRLIRSSANGRVRVYRLDFGRGHHVVTRVLWADPARDAQ